MFKAVKNFTKSDLTDGMVVITREGRSYMVFGTRLYFSEDITGFYLLYDISSYYREDLSSTKREYLDIVQVEYMGMVIWKREQDPNKKRIKEVRESMEKLARELKELENSKD